MASFLLLVPPLTGHINPLLAVADELQKRGHSVAWVGYRRVLEQHLPADAVCHALPEMDSTAIEERTQQVRGLESIKFFYEEFCFPMAEHSLAPLEHIVREHTPDILVCDHQMLAGALVARKLGLVWISSVTTSASILKPHDMLNTWLLEKLAEFQLRYGADTVVERPDFSPYGCIVFSSRELVGEECELVDAPYHFVGPAIGSRCQDIEFPWALLEEGRRKILISLGTVSRDRSMRFYEVMIEALGGCELQVIMVAPEDFVNEFEGTVPDNFIVCPRVPQLELLPYVDLVVSHSGHNTVCETLSHGKPMVLAPIRDDQPVIARQVVNAGAGLSVRFGKLTAATARKTIDQVLGDASFRENAERIQQSFQALHGAEQAASIMESLAENNKRDYAGCSC